MNNQDHHLCCAFPPEFTEDLKSCFPDENGLSYEELCMQQESLYLSFTKHGKNQSTSFNRGETSRTNPFTAQQHASPGVDIASQLALDEALARSLQIDDGFDEMHAFAGAGHSSHREPPVRVEASNTTADVVDPEPDTTADAVDPDHMSYEELQSLGDSIGHESKGLSDEMISRLPTFKYKTGLLFWKKKSDEECVICCSKYESRQKLASLLCAHTFHFKCIERWLKEKNSCPVCNQEVRDA